MKTRKLFLATVLMSIGQFVSAQYEDNMPQDTSAIIAECKIPSVGIGAGVLTFHGDIGKSVDISNYSHIRAGYNIVVQERLNNLFGLSLNGLFGKLAQSERSMDIPYNRNFESKIIQIGLNGIFHFDNDIILKRQSLIKPYFSMGVAFLKFDPYSDLKDADDITYEYWSDGSIRNLPENTTNEFCSGCITTRDYTYETQLTDPNNNYKRSTFTVPLTIGSTIRLNDYFSLSVATSYHITFSDYIDNTKNAGNDKFLYSHFTISYGLPAPTAQGERYKDVDFSSIDHSDDDADGVKDIYDRCLNTPKDVKVDNKGCPVDADADGVADYLDKEPNTIKGSIVDENGVTQTEQMIAQKAAEEKKTTASGPVMPQEYRFADKNKDGAISYEEVTGAIDMLFEGEANISVDTLYKLIEFFFDQ